MCIRDSHVFEPLFDRIFSVRSEQKGEQVVRHARRELAFRKVRFEVLVEVLERAVAVLDAEDVYKRQDLKRNPRPTARGFFFLPHVAFSPSHLGNEPAASYKASNKDMASAFSYTHL